MDSELKSAFDDTARNIGLSSAAAFNVFARQFVAHHGFPFAVVEPIPTEVDFAKEMDHIYLSMKHGNSTVHDLIEE